MVSLSGKIRDPIPLEDPIPREIVIHIVSYLPLNVKTLLRWDRISKQFYSVAAEHWVTLWNRECPFAPLKRNHRFACIQWHIYRQHNAATLHPRNDVKIVVVGGGGVGKSALTTRFIQGVYYPLYDPTIEDAYRKQIEVNGTAYMVDVLDTAGPEEYSAMQDQYFRATDAVLLCCDLMDSSSIDEMRNKMENLLRAKDADVGTLPIIISVNKCDLGLTDANLSMDQVREFAEEYKIPQIIYTSALENTNVTEVFSELVAIYVNVLQRHPEWIQKLENGEPITTMPTKKKCSVM